MARMKDVPRATKEPGALVTFSHYRLALRSMLAHLDLTTMKTLEAKAISHSQRFLDSRAYSNQIKYSLVKASLQSDDKLPFHLLP